MLNDHQLKWRSDAIARELRDPANWDKEDEALELAYKIQDEKLRDQALKNIADALTCSNHPN